MLTINALKHLWNSKQLDGIIDVKAMGCITTTPSCPKLYQSLYSNCTTLASLVFFNQVFSLHFNNVRNELVVTRGGVYSTLFLSTILVKFWKFYYVSLSFVYYKIFRKYFNIFW